MNSKEGPWNKRVVGNGGPKRSRGRLDGKPGRTPVAAVIETAEARRSAKADAAALDALLAAGKRLRPPPTKFERRAVSAGELALRRERRAGRDTPPVNFWSYALGHGPGGDRSGE